jgi:hypothetical protein
MLVLGFTLPLQVLLARLLAITVDFGPPLVILALHAESGRACTIADLLLGFFPNIVFAGGYFESTWSLWLAQP